MKIGIMLVTPEGLEKLAKAARHLGANVMVLEVHKVQDTHEEIRVCAKPEAGWIDLCNGWPE